MKCYSLLTAVALLGALVWVGCGMDQGPVAPDSAQQFQAAAKPAKATKPVSIDALKGARSIAQPDGRVVERRVNIFYMAGASSDEGSKGSSKGCYALFAEGARWKTTEAYVVDTSNEDGLTEEFVTSTLEEGLDTWDVEVKKFDLFGPGGIGAVDGADEVAPDGKNEVLFVDLGVDDIIAITIVWGIFGGPVKDRELVEWDLMLNDRFTWGNAGPTDETGLGDTGVMDLQNIVTHEVGHAAGLDHPSDGCTEETMYQFSENGETKKRTLHEGDIKGIKKLY